MGMCSRGLLEVERGMEKFLLDSGDEKDCNSCQIIHVGRFGTVLNRCSIMHHTLLLNSTSL